MHTLLLESTGPDSNTAADLRDNEELMERIQAGDSDALSQLHRRHQPLFRTIIVRLVGNDTDVDDILQDCLMEIWKTADNYQRERGQAIAWLVTLVRRRAIDRIRRKAAYRRAVDRFCEDWTALSAIIPTRMEHNFGQSDRAAAMEELVAKLPEPQQVAVRMAFYEGMTHRQIAAATRVPLGTIKTRLELALRKLRSFVLVFGELHEPPRQARC